MRPKFPIFIPSKARSEFCKTAELLGDFPFKLVVEPQDAAAYNAKYGAERVMVLPADNKGLPYSRNSILEAARFNELENYWMIDDDLTAAYLTENKKNVKTNLLEVLARAEAVLLAVPDLAIGALEYQQYAWSVTKPVTLNSYCDVTVLINVKRTRGLRYREGLKHDRDFVLQCLTRGFASARSSHTSFACPRNGSNKGGLFDEYANGKEQRSSAEMVKRWPGVCEEHIKADGRPDVKINWRLFKKK